MGNSLLQGVVFPNPLRIRIDPEAESGPAGPQVIIRNISHHRACWAQALLMGLPGCWPRRLSLCTVSPAARPVLWPEEQAWRREQPLSSVRKFRDICGCVAVPAVALASSLQVCPALTSAEHFQPELGFCSQQWL